MLKSLVALAILGAMSASATAQTAAPADTQSKPQTVKKRVCFKDDEDSYSRLGGRKICKTIEVPAQPSSGNSQQTAPQSGESR